MEMNPMVSSQPKTDEDYKREIDRMEIEIRAMLDEAGRRTEHARCLGRENKRILDELEKRYLCGKG